MKEDFNLSEKVYKIIGWGNYEEFFSREDVKEFIKRLKESFIDTNNLGYSKTRILEKIDKLSGDKLI